MADLRVQPDDSIWDRLKEKGKLLEATYVDPAVSQYVRDEGRRLGQYYSEPPVETEESKKHGSIRATRVSDNPQEALSDILGLLPQGALAKMGGLAAAKGMMFVGMARAPKPPGNPVSRSRSYYYKQPSSEQMHYRFPSTRGWEELPVSQHEQLHLPWYGESAKGLDGSAVADIGEILGNYQKTTQDALNWMRSDPTAGKLGYSTDKSIPKNLRNIRNNAILKDDTRAMSVDDLVKNPDWSFTGPDSNMRFTPAEREAMRKFEEGGKQYEMDKRNLMRGEEEDMISAGEIPWEKQRPTNFLNGGDRSTSIPPTVNRHLEDIADRIPSSGEFLDRTQSFRTGDKAGKYLDFLTEHRANKLGMDDQMVRDMLTQFDNPKPISRTPTPYTEQGALPFYDKEAREKLMAFYDKSQRFTPTVPTRPGQVVKPTPEGGNAPFRDFRGGLLEVPEIQLPGSKEPIGVRRYDTSAGKPLPEFMLKRADMGTEVAKPFVFDMNKKKTFDEVLLELMNSSFKLPSGVR